jgi:hypothetical protein
MRKRICATTPRFVFKDGMLARIARHEQFGRFYRPFFCLFL